MNHPSAFLSGDPDDVGELLLQVARRERAPHGARDRALARVAAVSVGAVVASTAKAAVAAPTLTGGGGILAAKWLVVGLGGALVSLTAIDRVGRALAPAADPVAASATAASPAEPHVALATPALSISAPIATEPVTNPVVRPAPVVTPSAPAPAAPEPVSASPSAASFAEPSSAQLAREVAALRRARAALAQGKPGPALETLAAYHREFGGGVLDREEAALRVEIAFAMGDPKAPELAQRFVAQNPASPLAARVRSLLDAKRASGAKP
jgi:hypothetical protein